MTIKYLLSGFRKGTLYTANGSRYELQGNQLVEIQRFRSDELRSLHRTDLMLALLRLKKEPISSTHIDYSISEAYTPQEKFRIGTEASFNDKGELLWIGCQLFDKESTRRLREWALPNG